ncbi:MAG: hypothetical protein MK486_00850 [Gemmatimonadetes bacterium]|nr:hypothetical protein [Gemmatimonadota bacterium]HAC07060.1 hypothetical protein [Gemmatimonadota bacterium]HBD99398.1 hypothetical protein [Gemmatimonadota bacterium]HIN50367.1 hypothetical protein [Gemmatimonadota bacterium]
MARIVSVVGVTMAVVAVMAPRSALSQTDHAADGHSHASAPVSCTTLASPPWTGLPDADRLQFASLQQTMAALRTPEAARAAGFQPALGNIPGMGVHYVNSARGRDPVNIDEPDHLMFSSVDGREQLVGAAFVFVDVPDTDEPIPFQSELATWHDHPQFADEGRTLHMLHVWFIPSSNGPFAGLNFWLPYHSAGIATPSSCWMADEADANRIQNVSFALVPPSARRGPEALQRYEARQAERSELLAALDAAALAVDHDAWVAAADVFLADLTQVERRTVEVLLSRLNMAQMSSRERGGNSN